MVADEKPAFVPAEPVAEADGTSDLENMTESAEEAAGEDALSALRAELAEQTAKAKEHLDQWKRTAADFANYRKRQMKEQEQIKEERRRAQREAERKHRLMEGLAGVKKPAESDGKASGGVHSAVDEKRRR